MRPGKFGRAISTIAMEQAFGREMIRPAVVAPFLQFNVNGTTRCVPNHDWMAEMMVSSDLIFGRWSFRSATRQVWSQSQQLQLRSQKGQVIRPTWVVPFHQFKSERSDWMRPQSEFDGGNDDGVLPRQFEFVELSKTWSLASNVKI
jgi:hypothetical protein